MPTMCLDSVSVEVGLEGVPARRDFQASHRMLQDYSSYSLDHVVAAREVVLEAALGIGTHCGSSFAK